MIAITTTTTTTIIATTSYALLFPPRRGGASHEQARDSGINGDAACFAGHRPKPSRLAPPPPLPWGGEPCASLGNLVVIAIVMMIHIMMISYHNVTNHHNNDRHLRGRGGGLRALPRPGLPAAAAAPAPRAARVRAYVFGRGGDTVGNPHRAQSSPLELFELCPVALPPSLCAPPRCLVQLGGFRAPEVVTISISKHTNDIDTRHYYYTLLLVLSNVSISHYHSH